RVPFRAVPARPENGVVVARRPWWLPSTVPPRCTCRRPRLGDAVLREWDANAIQTGRRAIQPVVAELRHAWRCLNALGCGWQTDHEAGAAVGWQLSPDSP